MIFLFYFATPILNIGNKFFNESSNMTVLCLHKVCKKEKLHAFREIIVGTILPPKVNTTEDDASKLATDFSPSDIVFFKKAVRIHVEFIYHDIRAS